jgi:hypothetical protein
MIASIRQPILIVCLALLIAPLLAVVTAPQRMSHDEATALWVVHDFDDVFGVAPRDAVTNAVSNVRDWAHRVQEQPQPPLYFFLLDGWTTVFGDSLVSARTLSFMLALIAIAVVAIAGKKRALWLVAANAFALPAAEIYLYSLLLLLSALSYLAFNRWRSKPRYINSILYIVTLILLWYTSFAALIVIVIHAAILYASNRKMPVKWLIIVALSTVIFLPYLALFLSVDRIGDHILSAIILPSIVAALPYLVLRLGNTSPLQTLENRAQSPYALAAFALTVAGVLIIAALLIQSVKTDWRAAIDRLNADRQPLDPTLLNIPPTHPLAYFQAQDGDLQRGISVDVGWDYHTPETIQTVIDAVNGAPSIWTILLEDDPKTALILDSLSSARTRGVEWTQGDVLFDRFDME